MPRRRAQKPESLVVAELPILPVRDTVLFPHMMSPLFVDRDRSLRAIEEATMRERTVLIVSQKNSDIQRPRREDLYDVGTEAVIGRVLKMPEGTTSVLVQGQRRVKILDLVLEEPYLMAQVAPLEERVIDLEPGGYTVEALMRAVLVLFEKCVKLSHTLPDDAYVAAMNVDEPGWLADLVGSTIDLPLTERQQLLEMMDPVARLQKVSIHLAKELDVLELESKIHSQVQKEVDKSQREYFLREQIKAIQRELGETDILTRDVVELRERIEASGMPAEVAKKAEAELERLSSVPSASPEVAVIRNYVDWLVGLPWATQTEDHLDLAEAALVLNSNHYGLAQVKERILEYMAVRKMAAQSMRSPILCFVGPPGVGKTSLGRSIAQALGRKFVRISLGGIRDEAEIRGHRRTYVGALPGRIVQTMRSAATTNPVFMLDEIDKIGADFRGDPSAALLEVLDPEQNRAFSDHYLDVPYDLSRVLFITTANTLDPVPPALRDRMEVIELPGYIEDEKLQIAKQFLVPKQLLEHGLGRYRIRFTAEALEQTIRQYTHEAGVRNLEREVGSICRKVARRAAEGRPIPAVITEKAVPRFLGPEKFFYGAAEERDEIGVATAVYWSPNGGDVMAIEVALMDGKGNLVLTGQLGDVMKESAQAALTYSRSRSKTLGVRDGFYEQMDIHVHVPAGSVPKDGPSAGITIATALISALTRQPTRKDVAMTGEITLRGRVLPVGGVREKVLAAHRAGITTFILPQKNLKDLSEVPTAVRRQLRFVPVDHMDQVLPVALANGASWWSQPNGNPPT
ncbi:MAG: endopeptidase La [Bacteroidetes bacterium]|nr:endopeptidase La [Bacteroidota bacterium]